VIMEVDCLEIVNLWNTRYGSRSSVTPILSVELSSVFNSFVIQHVLRTANLSAHLSAKHACTLEVTSSWLDAPQIFLSSVSWADLAGSCVKE
jgi:hypothetical protein